MVRVTVARRGRAQAACRARNRTRSYVIVSTDALGLPPHEYFERLGMNDGRSNSTLVSVQL